MQKILVRKGQKVKRGQRVGLIGDSGKTTGVHLHYEVLKNDVAIDPIHFFSSDLSPEEYEKIIERSTIPSQTMD